MLDLILCIVFSAAIVLTFKAFDRYPINHFAAIVINYFTAGCIGLMVRGNVSGFETIPQKEWFFSALLMGGMFIFLLNLLSISARKIGVSVAAVAFKMGLVIPIIATGLLYPERNSFSFLKIAGIVMVLIAVVMTSLKEKNDHFNYKMLFLPFVLFIGSGFCDAYYEFTKEYYLPESDLELFNSSVFFIASLLGFIILIIKTIKQPIKINTSTIIGGMILGIPNFFSFYYLYKALNAPNIQSSVVFPVNSMGIVALSALLSVAIFKEKLSKMNWLGIVLAMVAIGMIALG